MLALPQPGWAGERGFFGFSLAVASEGFSFNPVLKSIKVAKVTPDSPAAQAGLKDGDEIIEVAGRTVAGSKAKEMMALAQKEVGQSLQLKVKRPEGETRALTLVAVKKPE
jgi:C-terminal processing protease CtpA/Prc